MSKSPSILVAFIPIALALVVACGGQAPSTATPTAVKATSTATPTTTAPTATPAKVTGGATPTIGGAVSTPSAVSSGETVVKVEIATRAFVPAKFSFQKDKSYTLAFSVPEEFHTFTVRELGIDIYIEAGKTVKQTVTFAKAGNFSLICTVHEGEGMVGAVTVS